MFNLVPRLNIVSHIWGGQLGPFCPHGNGPGGPQKWRFWAKNLHFWSILGPPMGISRQAKRSQLTILDVKYTVQPSLTDVQPI